MKALAIVLCGSISSLLLAAVGCGSSSSNNPGRPDGGGDGGGASSSGMTSSGGADSGHDGETADSTGSSSGDGSMDGSMAGEGGESEAGDDGGSCVGSLSGFMTATYQSATVQHGACTPTDIQTFLTDCVDNTDPSTCDTWLTSNTATDAGGGTTCGDCLFNATNSGAVWVDPNLYTLTGGMLTFNPNYGACIQLTDSTYGAGCAAAFNNQQSCEDVACNSCPDPNSYDACLQVVDPGSCSTYVGARASACVHDDGDGGAYDTCTPSNVSGNVDDDYTYIINLMCGS